MGIDALLNTLGTRCRTLPLVILYVTEGCNLRCISCSYRNPSPGELTLEELERLAITLKDSGLHHIVYSGGEPLLRRDFPQICALFRAPEIRQTLLTNGLLLEKRFGEIREFFREIIISLDGPDEETHNAIRGLDSFRQIVRGVRTAASPGSGVQLSIRTVIQKRNFRSLIGMVRCARDLGVSRISFLAADVRSEGFGRAGRGAVVPEESLLLDAEETSEFRTIIARMASECSREFSSGFIAESPSRLLRLAEYFEALIGRGNFPQTNCNAPMVSTVITSTGELLPCYFLPGFGNIREAPLSDLMNGPGIRSTRSDVRAGTPDPCKTCVCTLKVSPSRALLGRF
jgi:MoaA/NifB/PqqE/SkfB family radical SAM enzyme